MNLSQSIKNEIEAQGLKIEEMSTAQIYETVSLQALKNINRVWKQTKETNKKQAYYLSAEFLVGRLVNSNLLNMNKLEEVNELLQSVGGVNVFEEVSDCALGNGGLGRLAACFLDSAATQNFPLNGYGIRYKYGLFKQSFKNGCQTETADDWTANYGDPWSVRADGDAVTVEYSNFKVKAVPYDMPVIGYGAKTVNTLRLWQSEAEQAFDFIKFNNGDYNGAVKDEAIAERISAVLYPNDNSAEGKRLRLAQEYFFTSASIQDIVRRLEKQQKPLDCMENYAAIQLNDTHPVLAIPELIRILKGKGYTFKKAFEISSKVFAYTNHTIMSEALEKWDCSLVKKLLPKIFVVIKEIQKALEKELASKNTDIYNLGIIDGDRIHMARLAVFCSYKTNGVAKIHSEILKADVFKEWYKLYPERFCNKTNGITQRRWLALNNKYLADFITSKIGDGWITNLDKLKDLECYAADSEVLKRFKEIKNHNKKILSDFIERKEGIKLNPDFIFDIQIKRLHEYKRQLMNAFSLVYIYNGLLDGSITDFNPTAFIFGAKAAPGYKRAKGVIKYINEIAAKINADERVNDKIKVIFVTDYNVSYAEKLVSAGDISEQISAAGTEASGTGNMKLMLNGAVTLGTYDGANIEIVEAAGEENNFIFGARVDELKNIEHNYNPHDILNSDQKLKAAVETLVNGTFSDGGTGDFQELYDSLTKNFGWHKADQYFIIYDFNSYIDAKLKAISCYGSEEFTKKCFLNTVNAGRFSSDRTIKEYAKEIWNI